MEKNHQYLECHSRGDRRFSALYARLKNSRSIEQLYQGAKRDEQGQPFASPKGKRPKFMFASNTLLSAEQIQYQYYRMLWHLYFLEHRDLLVHASTFDGFRDIFDHAGGIVYIPTKILKEKPVCMQSFAIADIVHHVKDKVKYTYEPLLALEWAKLKG